jgi:beta-glucosidase/6-phospho-beta-glucosidase/beta-galactosidase
MNEINPMAANLPKMIQASTRMQAQLFNNCMKYNIEVLNFLKHRFEQDMRLVESVTKTEDTGKAFKAYMNFWQSAVREYTDEAGKLAAINNDVASKIEQEAHAITENMSTAGNA